MRIRLEIRSIASVLLVSALLTPFAASAASIATDPSDLASLFYKRGVAWREDDAFDRALADFSEAIRLNPKFATAHRDRGYELYRSGTLGKDPEKTKTMLRRAIADFTTAVKLDPKDPLAYYWRAEAYQGIGEFDRASFDYNEAIKLKPDEHAFYWGRAAARHRKGDLDGAIDDYAEVIRLDPKQAWVDRGNAWLDKKEFDRAIEDYTEAIKIDPQRAVAYYNRGMAYRNKKDTAKADADFKAAAKIDPKLGEKGPGSN